MQLTHHVLSLDSSLFSACWGLNPGSQIYCFASLDTPGLGHLSVMANVTEYPTFKHTPGSAVGLKT